MANADFPIVTCHCGFSFDPKEEQPAFSAPSCVIVPSISLLPALPTKEAVPWQKILGYANMPDPGGHVSDRYVLALLYYLGAVGLIALGVVATFAVDKFSRWVFAEAESEYYFTTAIFWTLAFSGSAWLIREARKCTARRATDIARSRRAHARPILLLRSFSDDEMQIGERDVMFGKVPIILEDVVVKQLERFGPIIAIGRPGESNPPPAAARLWCHSKVWQGAIQQLVGSSQFIVIILGAINRHPGSQWEMKFLAQANCADKLILVMPPVRESEARHRWGLYRKLLNWQIPVYQPGLVWAAPHPEGGFQATVVSPDGNGEFVRNAGAFQGQVNPYERTFRAQDLQFQEKPKEQGDAINITLTD